MQLSETLMLAGINEVERRGWAQDTIETHDGRVCAIGGLNAAAFGEPHPSKAHNYAHELSYDAYLVSLPNINDSNRTPAPVFRAMRRLAARLSPYGKQADTTEDTTTLNEWSA